MVVDLSDCLALMNNTELKEFQHSITIAYQQAKKPTFFLISLPLELQTANE